MNLLLTGASGFLGAHLLDCLQKDEQIHRIFVTVRNKDDKQVTALKTLDNRIQLVVADLSAPEQLFQLLSSLPIDAIVHTAAVVQHTRNPDPTLWSVNLESTRVLVTLAARNKAKFLFVSTSGVVGCSLLPSSKLAALPDEHAPYVDPIVRTWPYYQSKILAEKTAFSLASLYQIPITVFRPPVLLGPGDHKHRSTGHIRRMLQGKLPFLIQGGIHFVDVRDVAQAIVTALHLPDARPLYHLPGSEMDIVSFFQQIAQIAKRDAPRWQLPAAWSWWLCTVSQSMAKIVNKQIKLPDPVVIEMAQHYWGLASSYAREDLDFVPRAGSTTLADTIQSILNPRQINPWVNFGSGSLPI